MLNIRIFYWAAAFNLAIAPTAMSAEPAAEPFHSSPAERGALFDHLLETVMHREAFSPYKAAHFSTDIAADLRARRGEFLAAETAEQLYYALVRFSNTRRDRHLYLEKVPGGVAPASTVIPLQAPLRFAVDFSQPGRYSLFVADVAPAQLTANATVAPGDLVISINGRTPTDHAALVAPYLGHSTWNNLWYHVAETLTERSALLPPELRREQLHLVLEGVDGTRRSLVQDYLESDSLDWTGHNARGYPDFEAVFTTSTYALFRHSGRRVLLLQWHGFGDDLVRDIDRLITWAQEAGTLNHDLILDATRSRGGSFGAYALQRLSPKPFKTTFGNLRISDVTAKFVAENLRNRKQRNSTDSVSQKTQDESHWLMQWLEEDVTKAINAGQEYTNNVPFKLAHAPKWSDGWLRPAPVHFTRRLVLLLGPHGGSHLDQFAAMIKDNGLGHIIGLPAGGFSNTWEWKETILMPGSGRPVAKFMWNIGHTIRPNGQILESNPALPDEFFPPSRANHLRYYPLLLGRAFAWLDAQADS